MWNFIANLRINIVYKFRNDNTQFGELELIFNASRQLNPPIRILDIGCFMPIVWNNSYKLRKLATTLNVDANPKLAIYWKLLRPREKFLNVAVTTKRYQEHSYIFHHDRSQWARNGFDESLLRLSDKLNETFSLTQVPSITTEELSQYTLKYLGTPDIILIDIEGLDIEVLLEILANLQDKPTFLLLENHTKSVVQDLTQMRYRLIGQRGPSQLYELIN